jgi:hypothetical protein
VSLQGRAAAIVAPAVRTREHRAANSLRFCAQDLLLRRPGECRIQKPRDRGRSGDEGGAASRDAVVCR